MRKILFLGIVITFLAALLVRSDVTVASIKRLVAAGTVAQSNETRQSEIVGLPNYDIRQEFAEQHKRDVGKAENPAVKARLDSIEQFRAKMEPSVREKLRVEINQADVPKVFFNYEAPLSEAKADSADQIAREFLTENTDIFGLTPGEVHGLKLENQNVNEGVTFLKYNQTVNGIHVFHGHVNLAISQAGEVLSVNMGMIIPDAKVVTTPNMSEAESLKKAFEHVGRDAPTSLKVIEPAPTQADRTIYANPLGANRENILSDLRVMLVGDKPILAWHSYIDVGPGEWYEVCVNADTGELLFRHNLHLDAAQGTVYPQSPRAGGRIVTPFPVSWIDMSTVTTGNNVDAYVDANRDNVPDPDNSTGMSNGHAFSPMQNFTFPFTPSVDPQTQRPAVVTNLFYFVNQAHDFHYNLGFTESAGNFQMNNFGRGGAGGDPVLAEAQDSFVLNNATFTPTTDGISPRMQMGLSGLIATVTCDNSYEMYFNGIRRGSGSVWWQARTFNLDVQTGKNVMAISCNDVDGVAGLLAELRVDGQRIGSNATWKVSLTAPANWTDVNFDDSAWANATDYGQYGIGPWGTSVSGMPPDTPARWIWSSNNDLHDLVYVRVSFNATIRDSSLDGDVVFHEYGHGVSNRLVGGPSSTNCLIGIQSGALGEGWSDYWACTYYGNGSLGEYFFNNSMGARRAVYSVPAAAVHDSYTDLGIPIFNVHNDGEIWAATLWDLRQTLGSSITNRLVEQGMMFTSCSPSFINARDGILQADQTFNGGANRCQIWTVFARHGMGASATGSDDATHNPATDLPASCVSSMVATITCDNSYDMYFNGIYRGSGYEWSQSQTYNLPTQAGKNVVAIRCVDGGWVAGLLAELRVDGQRIGSNATWKVSLTAPANWTDVNFNDSGWANATDYGPYGVGPWGASVSGMPPDTPARWIWSSNNDLHDLVYVRVSFMR